MDVIIEYNPETKIICRKGKVPFGENNMLGKILFDKMKLNNDSIAQIYAPTGEYDTFKSLLEKSIRTAIEMKRLGLKAGDIISICSYNQLNTVVPYLAAQFLGIIVTAFDTTMEITDIKYLLDIVKPVMIFISDDCEEWIENAVKILKSIKIITFGKCSKFSNFADFLKPSNDEINFKPIDTNDGDKTAVILFTSGTTSYPKAVQLSHNYLLFNSRNIFNIIKGDKVGLTYSTQYWIIANTTIIGSIENNIARLLTKKFEADLFWKYVNQYRVDRVLLLPSQAISAYKLKPENWMPTNLKCIHITGASITLSYHKSITESLPGIPVLSNYGSTETGLITNDTNNSASNGKEGTIGFPVPGHQLKIVDTETGQTLGFNKVGELYIKSTFPMIGYYKNDASNCFDKDGFYKTGDLVYYDEDFCFYVTDRIKEMFKFRGWHIFPSKLEAILERHQDVKTAAVIGIPDSDDDNHAMGVVVLNEGANTTEIELQTFVNEQVEYYWKLRAGVKIVKSLPCTPIGKVNRNAIRKMLQNA